jgi:uracil DNA glycosylase
MGFRSVLKYRYDHTHENQIWNKLVSELKTEYNTSKQEAYLIGNLMAGGHELDALFIKEDCIVVIDFKNYGGALEVSENEPWTVSGVEINSGRKNPLSQLSDNKYAVLDVLKKKLPNDYENWINLGHIAALVLFHQDIVYDTSNTRLDLSQAVSMWFHISDFSHVTQTLDEITSKQTSIKGERAAMLFKALGVTDFGISEGKEDTREGIEDTREGIEDSNAFVGDRNIDDKDLSNDFANFYYQKANSLDEIKVLIVGQDPYRTNSNGVAFCKDSYYELYREGCSGGTVLKSLGLTKEEARLFSRKNPKNLFYELLTTCGICFINVFNTVTEQISVEQRDEVAFDARVNNLPLMEKANLIIILGKGKTKSAFEEYYPKVKYTHCLIHPSWRNKDEQEWKDTWATNFLENVPGVF